MKKYILLISLLLLSVSMQATDFPVLELLINSHKRQYDKMQTRLEQEAANFALGITVRDISQRYDTIKTALSKATNNTYGYLVFSKDMLEASSLAKEVANLEGQLVDLTLNHISDMPILALKTKDTQKIVISHTSEIISLTASILSGGLNTTMATQKQRFTFCMHILSLLQQMKFHLQTSVYYAKYSIKAHIPLNMATKELMTNNDFKRIADKIINKYQQSNSTP